MTISQMQEEILRLKKERDFCILAHAYQSHAVWEIADYIGDSFGLSEQAAKASHQNVLMCGVRFMAETAKILSPDKHVFLSHPDAGCPMAEQMTLARLCQEKERHPDYTVVAYINTTAALKTLADVCVTSSSAEKIVRRIPNDKILFIPDPNLGHYVASKVPEKQFLFVDGGCPIHQFATVAHIERARKMHPEAEILVHPECASEVVALADFVGSTTGIMAYAKKSEKNAFVIGTENSIVEHLQMECPDKQFYALSKECVCKNMKLTTLSDVYHCLKGEGGEEIFLEEATMDAAGRCIDEMLRLGE